MKRAAPASIARPRGLRRWARSAGFRLWSARVLLLAGLGLGGASCASGLSARGASTAGYRVWRDGEWWHLRAISGEKKHRFQGSVEGTSGGIVEVKADRRELDERVARSGNSVQFDFDVERGEAGFDARVTGGCLRFDLYLDGKRRPDRARFGPQARRPGQLPWLSCPAGAGGL